MDYFSQNNNAFIIVKIIYKWLPILIFAAYPVMLVYAFFKQSEMFLKVLLVPAGVFLLVTALRKIINEQRPYEKYGIPSLFNKTTKGQSMPSRHTASAFIIAIALMYINFDLGVNAVSVACLIALSRIFAGVHFIRDVIAGAGISIVCGVIFIFLI